MAITVTSLTTTSGFCVNGSSGDLSSCEEIVSAITGKQIGIRSIVITSSATITVSIGAGETASDLTALMIGPVSMVAGSCAQYVFNPMIFLPVSTALCVDASGAGVATVVVQGQIQ